MKLSSVLNKRLITPQLRAKTMEGVILEMMEQFVDALDIEPGMVDDFTEAVINRERQAVTAFGKEIAFPHARLDNFNDFGIMVGISQAGIDCKAPDKKPVKIFFLIIAAKSKNTQLLQALASLSALVQNEDYRVRLINAKTIDEIIAIVEESNVEFKKTFLVEDIMVAKPITVSLEMTAKDASKLLFTHNIAGAPVVQNGKLIGELTEEELIKMGLPSSMSFLNTITFMKDFEPFDKFFKDEDKIKVKDIYNKEVFTVSPKTSLVEAAFIFIQKSKRRLYVVDKDRNLIGIIMRHHLLMKVLHP